RRRDRRLALALLNVDRFKFINETLGHAYGDRLIAEVAERLRGRSTRSGSVGWAPTNSPSGSTGLIAPRSRSATSAISRSP
ncbi:diguanylate cyclase domain-containing protein, partial [Hydrogenibacillus schlegelii]|uniref:diguanylate cyclase domain-containing protein n=1 Tax=Hydrogenibacillus schlegelii TaxID=1484 RepID=UPI0034A08C2B